ncbi:ATP-dependent helicase [Dehalobacterium formicoaceticum]|uniref:DNA 3'-5' helicase n=1 Tax=Dehalobacterium formicoaceticum TaxID=51515 RepID=A0ABT1Y746_9FIRM|nr:ATP-dependent helicase [Dehalobacterium formicoaceticum]MCR6546709.1 ATP-dependent helicase [Dehalobacterium formicoaceticum]
MKLSNKQEQIVKHVEGAILVKAGPGSGKTRVLIERIKHLLLSKKRCKILALTFSNLAADEMKNRLKEDTLISDLAENVTVGTIHSFCLDLVQSRGNLIGLGKELMIFESNSDQLSILRDVFSSDPQLMTILKSKEKPTAFLQKCLSLISEQKKKFISPEMCELNEPFPVIYREYNERLLSQNALDFDDILFFAYKILTENPSVVNLYTSLYKFVCVDEAQDLNFAQYQVIKALCGDKCKNIMLVGDENQSIYGFNGSDSTLMSEKFVKDFKPTIYLLNENYRSAKTIVNFANKLGNYDSVSNYVYSGELKAYSFSDEKDEAQFVLDRIKELLASGHPDIENGLSYDSFSVIARNKYVLSPLETIFSELNIPFVYKKSSNGLENESDYMKVFELGIRILLNPKDIVHLRELCKITDRKSSEIVSDDNSIAILTQAIENTVFTDLLPCFQSLNKEEMNFSKVLLQLEEQLPASMSDEERYLIINDIEQWDKHWKKYSGQVQRENRTLLSFRNYISLGKTQDTSSSKGVSLLTAHMSKGLQYDVVFVIGLSEGTFPDYRAVSAGGSEMEQEKNNMYVAVTRAKRLCYLSYPRSKKMPWGDNKWQTPSRFLKDIDILDS